MPVSPDRVRSAHARVAALKRHQGQGPEVTTAERDLRAACLEDHVRRNADELTVEQRNRVALAALAGGAQ